jgi:hypothetical protein
VKFKVIFMIFNALILLSLGFIVFMPYFILGWDYTRLFWSNNWYLALAFLAILAALNGYFFVNWRLFNLLEAEKWPELEQYLERKIVDRKSSSRQAIRILLNTYLVRSNLAGMEWLESHLRGRKPALVRDFALEFGIPYLLKNDHARMETYFEQAVSRARPRERGWLKWNLAFARVLQKKMDEARGLLLGLLEREKTPVLLLLVLYLLETAREDDSTSAARLEEGKRRFRADFDREKFQRQANRENGNILAAILSKLIHEALDWLYGPVQPAGD